MKLNNGNNNDDDGNNRQVVGGEELPPSYSDFLKSFNDNDNDNDDDDFKPVIRIHTTASNDCIVPLIEQSSLMMLANGEKPIPPITVTVVRHDGQSETALYQQRRRHTALAMLIIMLLIIPPLCLAMVIKYRR